MRQPLPIFEVENLRVERDAVILHQLNWRVEAGQHWAILGANGSGKTSLLSAVTGSLTPTGGEIRIGDARYGASDWREVRRSVGLVSSSLGHRIENEQTAHDVVHSGLEAQLNYWGKVRKEEAAEAMAILRQVRAGHLARRPWRHLSQGERQRILIGRALMARLKILFLDEPCAGLDPVAREDFLKFLDQLARRRDAPTLVLVTHHVEEIIELFTHVLLLHRGTTQNSGPKREVLTSHELSKTFDADVTVRCAKGRYQLSVGTHADSFSL